MTYVPHFVTFDGVNDYLTRGADLTGNADGKEFSFSCWGKAPDISAQRRFLQNQGTRFFVQFNNGGQFRVQGRNSANTIILDIVTNNSYDDDRVHHFLASGNLATGAAHIYVDDVSDLAAGSTLTNDTIDFTRSDWSVGASPSGTAKIDGDIADMWFEDTYLDFSVESNRRKFIDASHNPVDLGSDGSTPTGASNLITLNDTATSTWHTNNGTGGGFTENGAIADGPAFILRVPKPIFHHNRHHNLAV